MKHLYSFLIPILICTTAAFAQPVQGPATTFSRTSGDSLGDVSDSAQQAAGLMWIRLDLQPGQSPIHPDFQGLDIARYHYKTQQLDLVTTREQYTQLVARGYQIQVLSSDSRKDFLPRLRRAPKKAPEREDRLNQYVPDHYRSYQEVVDYLFNLQAQYPEIVQVDSIGRSHENRAIWLAKIAENVAVDDPTKAGVLYTALHHAREVISPEVLLYFMDYLVTEYNAENARIQSILASRQLWFVPIVNPDGHVYVFETEPLWRKNRRDNADGTFGVDLNRNYSYKWGYDNEGSSPVTSEWNYRGPGPFSEPETDAIRNFLEGPGSEDRNITISPSYHSWGNLWLYPWGYVLEDTPENYIYASLGDSVAAYNGYIHGGGKLSAQQLGYTVNGDYADYMYGEQTTKPRIFGVIPEVGEEFIPDTSLIAELVQENLGPNILMAEYADLVGRMGNITVTSRNYSVPGVDSVVVTAAVTNPAELSQTAFFESWYSTFTDTLQLFDDGNHHDGAAGDSLFGNTWLIPTGERYYSVGIKVTTNTEDTLSLAFHDIARFTTIGPVMYDSYMFTGPDTIPNPGDRVYFYLALKNTGSTGTATKVSATISSTDSCVSGISRSSAPFGDISAGALVPGTGNNYFSIDINGNCPGNTDLSLNLSITSEGFTFWSDTFSVHVNPLGIAENESTLPTEFALHPAYPNPFNPVTTLRYDLPQRADVTLTIYDILGREVRTLVQGAQAAGYQSVTWGGSDDRGQPVSSGVYLYRIEAEGFSETRKMVLLK